MRTAIRAALLAVLAAAARAGDLVEISMPVMGALYRWDPASGQLTPFCTGLGIPFYGVWADDGFLYMPDRGFGIVWKIDAAGHPVPFAAGGWLLSPVTVVQAPDGGLIASDVFTESIVRLDAEGNQTLLADVGTSGGLLSAPGGMCYDLDGTLYVSNNTGNSIASVDDQTGVTALVSDGQGLLDRPGGVTADGAGNLYVANYGSSGIARIRVEDGSAETFCADAAIQNPNDVRLLPDGGVRVTTGNHILGVIDALGQLTVLADDASFGEWDGNVSQSDLPPCSGRFVKYGAGLAGSGGVLPELRAVFSPCPGASVALEMRNILGDAKGALAWGLSPAALPFKGGTLLVNLGPPGGLIPMVFPGVGPGGGGLVLPYTFPDDPLLAGVSVWLQVLAKDPGAPKGVSLSNGLEERIGG
jgi:streptogramin lyase